MLQCYVINSPDIKTTLYEKWLTDNNQWIVNDLESKIWLKNWLSEKQGPIVPSDQVLRASELWQNFLFQLDPTWRAIPPQYSQFLVEKWMSEINDSGINPKDYQKLYQTMGQILPTLCHPNGEEMMRQWFSEKEEAKERLEPWFNLSLSIWKQFLSKRVLPEEWLKGLLVDNYKMPLENKNIVVDLNLDIDDLEAELILNLSRNNNIKVIVPKLALGNSCYDSLISNASTEEIEIDSLNINKTYKKLPSMLSEVKEAVAQIRLWLEEGIPANRLALVSPQIENYWPTLSEYLQFEGIAVNKAVATPLSQFPFIQKWLANMRLALNEFKPSDGEFLAYSPEEVPTVDFDIFRQYFTQVYDVNDFERLPEIQKVIPRDHDPGQLMSLSDFLSWSSQWVESNLWDHLIEVLENLDALSQVDEALSCEQWLRFFQNYFSRNEKILRPAKPDGLQILSFNGAQNQNLEKIMVLGLTESNLKDSMNTPLQWGDILSIQALFGFNLPHEDRGINLKKLHWVSLKQCKDLHLIYAESDFSGQFQAPSLEWLKGVIDSGQDFHMTSPQATRWDEVSQEKQNIKSEEVLNIKLDQDLGLIELGTCDYGDSSLSASSMEEYLKCPFKYFSRKSLGLDSSPHIDLDIDPMSKGRILHRICELVVAEKLWLKAKPDYSELVDKAKDDIDAQAYSEPVWNYLKPLYIDLAQSFIQFEGSWRQKYPETKTYAVEKKIKTHLLVENSKLKFSDDQGRLLRGVIDRIDQADDDQLVVIDYKSSSADLRQYSSWIKNGKIQMLLYSLALRHGVSDNSSKEVVGAYYYVLKDMDRNKGFHLKSLSEKFLPKTRSALDVEKINSLMEESEELIVNLLEDINLGKYAPQPKEEKLCVSCDWNQICRHPNLNL